MKILVSNDDGVFAPGIRALNSELSTFASTTVIAPDRNRSGASNSLTLSRPLHVRKLDNDYHSVDGTPTDCVHLALTGYFDEQFDMVVSGINEGANLGDDVLYSGTVAAAMEGRHLGLPAIAISMVGINVQHFDTGAIIAKQLVLALQDFRLQPQTILNVNIPDLPLCEIKGLQVTRLGAYHQSESAIKANDPRNRPVYWIGPNGAVADAELGTDFYAIQQGYISITPLQIDMTNYKIFDDVVTLMQGIELIS